MHARNICHVRLGEGSKVWISFSKLKYKFYLILFKHLMQVGV